MEQWRAKQRRHAMEGQRSCAETTHRRARGLAAAHLEEIEARAPNRFVLCHCKEREQVSVTRVRSDAVAVVVRGPLAAKEEKCAREQRREEHETHAWWCARTLRLAGGNLLLLRRRGATRKAAHTRTTRGDALLREVRMSRADVFALQQLPVLRERVVHVEAVRTHRAPRSARIVRHFPTLFD